MTPGNLCVVVHPMTGNGTELMGWWTGQAAPGASDEKVELEPKRPASRNPERMQSTGPGH